MARYEPWMPPMDLEWPRYEPFRWERNGRHFDLDSRVAKLAVISSRVSVKVAPISSKWGATFATLDEMGISLEEAGFARWRSSQPSRMFQLAEQLVEIGRKE